MTETSVLCQILLLQKYVDMYHISMPNFKKKSVCVYGPDLIKLHRLWSFW